MEQDELERKNATHVVDHGISQAKIASLVNENEMLRSEIKGLKAEKDDVTESRQTLATALNRYKSILNDTNAEVYDGRNHRRDHPKSFSANAVI